MAYILGTIVVFNIFSIIYDVVTGDAFQLVLASSIATLVYTMA